MCLKNAKANVRSPKKYNMLLQGLTRFLPQMGFICFPGECFYHIIKGKGVCFQNLLLVALKTKTVEENPQIDGERYWISFDYELVQATAESKVCIIMKKICYFHISVYCIHE